MKLAKIMSAGAVTIFWATCFQSTAQVQGGIDPDRLGAIGDRLSQIRTTLEALPAAQQQTLSAGAQNVLTLARNWNQTVTGLASLTAADIATLGGAASLGRPPLGPSFPAISDPSADFSSSITAGFTQSETSTAWCGNQVVTAFNDSGSLLETLPIAGIGLSFSGAAISSNRGASFRDIGYINPGPNVDNFLQGDPVVTCVPGISPIFYYTQIFGSGPANAPINGIGISKSTDGGATWGNPVFVAQKDGRTHFLDKPWHAIDPTNSNNLFVTYTDFDISGTSCGVNTERTAIELVRSTDGGVTWSSPQVIVQGCFASPTFLSVQGSQIAFDSVGTVYVAWEDFSNSSGTTRDLKIVRSTNHGVSFGAAVKISNVTYTGDGSVLQGGIRNNEFPSLAIGPTVNNATTLFVVWNDGRNFRPPDLEAGRYGYADVMLGRSNDGGATWLAPLRVNNDPLTHFVSGRLRGADHFQPGVAVDAAGSLGVCWYDRSTDPLNFMIGRTCGVSFDHGVSWAYYYFPQNWAPSVDVDAFVAQNYLGDYDTVASDITGATLGFMGAFGMVSTGPDILVPNQDVVMFAFSSASRR